MGAVSVREVGEAGLCRERVATEPALERFVERGTGLRPLRGVQVQVGEAGQEDLAVGEAGEPVESGQFGADGVVLRVGRGEDGRDDAVGADEIQRLGAIRDVGFALAAVGRAFDGEGDGARVDDDRFCNGSSSGDAGSSFGLGSEVGVGRHRDSLLLREFSLDTVSLPD